MSAHSPGPWVVGVADWSDKGNARYEISSHKHICATDARLIEAAPDLLEALREMVAGDAEAILDASAYGVPFPDEMLEAYRKAVAAIAKATGAKP